MRVSIYQGLTYSTQKDPLPTLWNGELDAVPRAGDLVRLPGGQSFRVETVRWRLDHQPPGAELYGWL